jgi:hypothetical protein
MTTFLPRRSTVRAQFVALPMCSVLALAAIQCGGDNAGEGGSGGNNNNLPVDGSTGGNGMAGGPGLNQDGGRTELTAAQVDEILGAECTGWSGEGESVPATLQLVVDTSGSMTQQPPGGNGPSKWEITRAALEAAIAGLPPAVSVGVLYYPNKNVTSSAKAAPGPVSDCVTIDAAVPLAPLGDAGSPQRTSFESSLDAVSVESYTPTHDAYKYALEQHLVPYPAASKFLLLITDGAPTIDLGCTWPTEPAVTGELYDGAGSEDGATDPIVAQVQAALDTHGIRTFLIGAPGSEKSVESGTDKRPWLSQAAIAGGTDTPGCTVEGPDYCHFDMTESADFAAELTAGLAAISSQVVNDCTFKVPADAPGGGTIEPEDTQVIIEWGNGKKSLLIPDGIGECSDGWRYNTADQTIVLCNMTCDEVQVDPQAVVHVSFGCSQSDIDDIVK